MTDYINRFRPSEAEIERRYANVRAAMEKEGLDALVVSGSEYTGFEGGGALHVRVRDPAPLRLRGDLRRR